MKLPARLAGAVVAPGRTLAVLAREGAPLLPVLVLVLLAFGLSRPEELARAAAQGAHGALTAVSTVLQALVRFFGFELVPLAGVGLAMGAYLERRGVRARDPVGAALHAAVPALLVIALHGIARQALPGIPPIAPLRRLNGVALLACLPIYLPMLASLGAWVRHELRASPGAADGASSPPMREDRFGSVVFWAVAGVAALLVVLSVLGRWERVAPPSSGDAPPSLALPLLDGTRSTLESLRGKVVVVDFWATWCPPCVESMPALDALAKEAGPRGLVALAVNRDDPAVQAKAVPAFLKKHGLSNLTVVLDDGPVGGAFRVQVLPTVFILDRTGRIAHSHVGGADVEELRSLVEPLLAAAPPP